MTFSSDFPGEAAFRQREQDRQDRLAYDVFPDPDSGRVYLAKSVVSPDMESVRESEIRLIADVQVPEMGQLLTDLLLGLQTTATDLTGNPRQGDQALTSVSQILASETGWLRPDEPLFNDTTLPDDPFPVGQFPEALTVLTTPIVDDLLEDIQAVVAHDAGIQIGTEGQGVKQLSKAFQQLTQPERVSRVVVNPNQPDSSFDLNFL